MQITLKISIILFLLSCPLFGHGDLHLRIQEISAQIKNDPSNPNLYLKRADLLLQHQQHRKSIKDLKRCKQLGLVSHRVDLTLAQNYYHLKRSKKVLLFTESILKEDSLNVKAWQLKAKSYQQQKEFVKAALDFEKVIRTAQSTLPENYLDASKAWEQATHSKALDKSKAIIERGIKDIGELIIFRQRLVELSIHSNDLKQAIVHQSKIIELSPRKEKPYYERALIYIQDKAIESAKNDLNLAISLINGLPPSIQNNQAMLELKASVLTRIQTL